MHGPCHCSHGPGMLLSQGGLEHVIRRLRRVRRGTADRTTAADGDEHSCQVTIYRHGGGPERLQCSRRARHSVRERRSGSCACGEGSWRGPDLAQNLRKPPRQRMASDPVLLARHPLLTSAPGSHVGPRLPARTLACGTTAEGDTFCMMQRRIASGDARERWLKRGMARGAGRVGPGAVEYRTCALVHRKTG